MRGRQDLKDNHLDRKIPQTDDEEDKHSDEEVIITINL